MQEIAGLSVEPCEGETIILVVFEIKKTEVLSLQNFQLFEEDLQNNYLNNCSLFSWNEFRFQHSSKGNAYIGF